jgi:hypothetical protein
VLIVLDGINQLTDRDGCHDLRWFPTALPPHVKFVISVVSGTPEYSILTSRPATQLSIMPPHSVVFGLCRCQSHYCFLKLS